MYRGRLWTMRQYAGFATAEESNRRYRYLLEQGSTGLSVAFDLPTQIGYDSDAPEALGEVGRVGVAIDSLADMETLFDGIPLDKVSTSMTINATAPILLAMYVAVGERQGVSPAKLTGTLQNDILKEYVARGTYRFPPGPSLRLASDIFAYCTEHVPKFNTISISGYHIREAGSTAAQEVGFTLADAVCYVETALKAGLAIDDFAPRLAFFFAAHTDLFEEVAKFRAARRLYAKIMRDRFGARDPRSQMLRFHTQTGGVTLTAQQPENNVVRVTLQALAAVLGGTQSLHTNGKDEALALPTEAAATLALRTQQILGAESGVTNTIDPLGGSYFVEQLTDRIEREAAAYIAAIDDLGGMVSAIERGFPQREIEQAAYVYNRSVDDGIRQVVGVNCFQAEQDAAIPLFRVDEASTCRQCERLSELRNKRDAAAVQRSLNEIRAVAKTSHNLMPPILAAVRAYATIGEICKVLAETFGEYFESYHS
jgi:methylmalonyl-CoA mutase N-terminal domain/subunit